MIPGLIRCRKLPVLPATCSRASRPPPESPARVATDADIARLKAGESDTIKLLRVPSSEHHVTRSLRPVISGTGMRVHSHVE